MKKISIKMKLIIIFVLIKIIPLLLVSYIAYTGILKLDEYLNKNTNFLFLQSKEVIINTANESINDSIKNLDKKSQFSIERLSYEIANNVAQFLYQRDEDILFLSKLKLDNKILESFYNTKKREILIHGEYYYDDKKSIWLSKDEKVKENQATVKTANLKDNEKEFNFTNPIDCKTLNIPIYKEVSYFDLKGNEKYKISQIDSSLKNISKKENTYINSESYFSDLMTLKKGQIYVSNVIGEYVNSKVIGTFTKEKANKANIEFEPTKYAYAGKENPLGKRFEGIIRFITPTYENGKRTGYVSLALDHEHIMQFTDTTNPISVNAKQDIADASNGNYAFMWDYIGRNISHPRDYFIVGYDKNTGKPSIPWLSKDIVKKQELSKKDIYSFLEDYPIYEEQSLSKKPNLLQLKENGNIALDCRYLNFAPQCQGWMQVTKNGGYGSFIIYWSNVWKLTTAAVIPYYTGQYASTKRGFGFITIGANVNEFHAAADKTKENVNKILEEQTKLIKDVVVDNKIEINTFIKNMVNELSVITAIMVFLIVLIALWLSNYISSKIEKLLIGTKRFANNELDYRIELSSEDEIGKLENSFNNMASKISFLIKEEKKINETLEEKIKEGIEKHRKQEEVLVEQSKMASLGEMIENIAHQWRQPLSVISTIVTGLKFKKSHKPLESDELDRALDNIFKNTTYLSVTIDDFRSFIRNKDNNMIFNPDDKINKSLSILKGSLLISHIVTILDLNTNINIDNYPNGLIQILVNLINNSKDAFEINNIKKRYIFISSKINNNEVVIKVRDNAKGIPENLVDKIFEPYFTTKHQSKGTGLGLYMIYKLLTDRMNGKINVRNIIFEYDNEEFKGAEFEITLPLNDTV